MHPIRPGSGHMCKGRTGPPAHAKARRVSFPLVDAIDGPDPSHEVHGRLTLPAGSGARPACPAASVVGQSARWAGRVANARVFFARRAAS